MKRHLLFISVLLAALVLMPTMAFAQKASKKRPRPSSVSVERNTYDVPADLESGESTVVVRTSNVIHKVAIAPNGIVAVEFPADDAVVSDHAGNSDLVTLDGKDEGNQGRRPTDPLIFRPGTGFPLEPVKGSGRKPLTMYSIQMASGLFISFLFYPVSDLSRNTNRVILRYKIQEIQQAREAAGLRTNMIANVKPRVVKDAERIVAAEKADKAGAANTPGQPIPVRDTPKPTPPGDSPAGQPAVVTKASAPTTGPVTGESKPGLPTSNPTASGTDAVSTSRGPALTASEPASDKVEPSPIPVPVKYRPAQPEFQPISLPAPVGAGGNNGPSANAAEAPATPPVPAREGVAVDIPNKPGDRKKTDRPAEALWMRVTRVGNEAKNKKIPPFGKPVHGLALSIVQVEDVSAKERIVVVAVRNTLTIPIRITPGQPELFIETTDKDVTVQSERLKPLFVWSTLEMDALFEPGTVQFYAIAFEPPIMGVQQTLRIGISQTNAADAPAGASLTEKGR